MGRIESLQNNCAMKKVFARLLEWKKYLHGYWNENIRLLISRDQMQPIKWQYMKYYVKLFIGMNCLYDVTNVMGFFTSKFKGSDVACTSSCIKNGIDMQIATLSFNRKQLWSPYGFRLSNDLQVLLFKPRK